MSKNITVSDLIELLDTKTNRFGRATGRPRELTIEVNGVFLGNIKSIKLDGWGDGLITDVCLQMKTEYKFARGAMNEQNPSNV